MKPALLFLCLSLIGCVHTQPKDSPTRKTINGQTYLWREDGWENEH